MKIWRRIIAAVLCFALIFTAINFDDIKEVFNASEPEIITANNDLEEVENSTKLSDKSENNIVQEEIDSETYYDIDDMENIQEIMSENEEIISSLRNEGASYSATSSRIGYHMYDGKEYPNMYMIYYSANNGEGKYEKETHQYLHNGIYSMHFYDHGPEYDGIPVYSTETDPELIHGEASFDYLIDDLILAKNVYERDNYNFIGWSTDKNGTVPEFYDQQRVDNLCTEDNGIIQLYALWKIAQTSFDINKNGGWFDWDAFYEINEISSEVFGYEDGMRIHKMPNGSELKIKEDENIISFVADCLTTLKIPDMKMLDDDTLQFVGFETSSSDWNADDNTFFFENKNTKPAIKALFLSSLMLEGEVNLHGYNDEGSVSLQWGTLASDDIGKVYKIAQSFDGENFEYIPDQNFTELIEGLEYGYTGSVQTFTAPIAGKYYIEAWGANGGIGYNPDYNGGYGGKTAGYVNLKQGQTIYLYVGEAGKTYAEAGTKRSYGGGGAAPAPAYIWRPNGANSLQGPNSWEFHVQGRGGGATYVSLTQQEISDYIPEDYTSISQVELTSIEKEAVEKAKTHVLMLAAGGSGRGDGCRGADGGGLIGPSVIDTEYHYGGVNAWTATGATQEAGGYGEFGTLNGLTDDYYYRTTTYGTFFYGSNGMTCSGAGGGGWFGGGMCYYIGGSGASSYLGTQAGLYDAETVVGGNRENIGDAANHWNVNGKVKIKICDYWITTNTSENIYSPDKEAPVIPSNVDSVLNNGSKGTVTWDVSEDIGSDYWYRVDAFDADDFNKKISESEVRKFNVTSGTTGYYYIVDNYEDTIVHPNNGIFTKNTFVSGIDMLDVGLPKYIHICSVDDADNFSDTVTILLNRTTVVVDPNEGGIYNGSSDVQSIILNSGEIYNVLDIVENENSKFVGWTQTTGDGIFDEEAKTITTKYAKTTIVASYMAPLVLEAEVNYEANNKKGSVDLKWHQDDELLKTYKIYISDDEKETWTPIRVAISAEQQKTDFAYKESGYQTYVVPGNGIYTLTAYGAAGGDFNGYKGGAGSAVTGTFNLNKGDILYIFTGGQGTNGGGLASEEGAAGGGATDIRLNGTDIENRILVAAGGSGANKGKDGLSETAGQKSNDILFQGTNAENDISAPEIVGKIPNNEAPDDMEINVSGGGGGYYGGTAGYKKLKANQIRVETTEGMGVNLTEWDVGTIVYKPKWISSTPITVTSYYNTSNWPQQTGAPKETLVGKKVWLYTFDSVDNPIIINGKEYLPYSIYGDAGFWLNGVHYDSYTSIWCSESRPETITLLMEVSPDGAGGYHVRNCPMPIMQAASGDINPGQICVLKIQRYEWGSPSWKQGLAGTSYVDNNIGTTESTEYGVNTGNGYASVMVYDYSAGDMDETNQDGVIAIDYAAPNAPYAGRILSSDGLNAVLTWQKPADNGTTYWNRAESYYADALEKINDSNITQTDVATGVEKYRWYADYEPEGEVTGTNSVEVMTNQITTSSEELTMYYHIAAVDYAGNIGPTYTFNPVEGIDIEIKVIWDDEKNELETRPDDNVTVSIYKIVEAEEGTQKVIVDTIPLDAYTDEEKLLFEHLPSVDENGNVIKYMAQIDGVVSENEYYDYVTSYSDDTYTITNTIQKLNRELHIVIEWNDANNWLNTRPDTFQIEVVDKDGNVVKTVEVDKTETDLDIPVALEEDITINVVGIDSKKPTNPYTTTVTPNGEDGYKIYNTLSYTLTIQPNGGTWQGSKENQSFILMEGESMPIPDPVNAGYQFNGWRTLNSFKFVNGVATMETENITLTAIWKKVPYKLLINPNGGIFEDSLSISTYTMYYGDRRIIQVPEKIGYRFIGWTLEGIGTTMTSLTERSVLIMGADDATLKANWIPRNIIVAFDPQGGTVEEDNIEVVYDSCYGSLPVPVKPGCEFVTWALDPDGKEPITESTIVNINEDHTIYAQYMPNTIALNGRIEWIDNNNAYESRPNELTVNILSDGKYETWRGSQKADGVSVETKADEWTFFKEMLQEYDITSNKKIEYSVKLNPETVESLNEMYLYETTYSVDEDGEFVITNTLKPVLITVKGRVEWIDEDNKYNTRPDSLELELLTDGKCMTWNNREESYALGFHVDTDWIFEAENMQEYDVVNGHKIDYTAVTNPAVVESKNKEYVYKTTYSKDSDGTIVITNTMEPKQIGIKGKIVWVDEDNIYNSRPDTLTVDLYSDGEHIEWIGTEKKDGVSFNVDATWTFLKDAIQEYDLTTDTKIDYTVKLNPDTVISKNIQYIYETSYSVDEDGMLIITNTLKPALISIKGRVEWIDENNKYNTRPSSLEVDLLTDGKHMLWNNKEENHALSFHVDTSWAFDAVDLQEYDVVNNHKIDYTAVTNPSVVESVNKEYVYKTTYSKDEDGTIVITNTMEPKQIGLKGKVVWVDDNNSHNSRPESLVADLFSDGEHIEWIGREKSDGISFDIKGTDWTFSKDEIQEYDLIKDTKINYTVRLNPNAVISKNIQYVYETTYSTDDDGTLIITNTLKPKQTGIKGKIVWVDEDNGNDSRPESLIVNLLSNGRHESWDGTERKDGITFNVNSSDWTFLLDAVQEYILDGDKIDYSVILNPMVVVSQNGRFVYETSYDVDEDGMLIITNTLQPKETKIKGRIEWIDDNNKFSSRPSSLNINLLTDEEFMTWNWRDKEEGIVMTSSSSLWTFERSGLQEYNLITGEPIVYSVILNPDPAESLNVQYAYKTTYSVDADGTLVITNELYEAKMDLSGTLTWIDKSNKWGSRPDETIVVLYADGKELDRLTLSAENAADSSDVWSYEFKGVNIYNKDGSEIVYTVKTDPDPVESNNTDDAYKATCSGLNITERLMNVESAKVIKGTITWVDDDDRYHYRPESSIIVLYAGEGADKKEVARKEISSDSNEFFFDNLPKYDADYNLIKYTLEEIIDDVYTVNIEGRGIENSSGIIDNYEFDVINTLIPREDAKPNTDSNIFMRVVIEDENKLNEIGFTKSKVIFPVRLIALEKIFTGKNGSYEISYGKPTDKIYSASLGDEYIQICGLWPGKYLIDIDIIPQFDFIGFESLLEDGIEVIYENDNWYLLISPEAKDATIHIDAVVKPVWSGYYNRHSVINYFASKNKTD